MAVFLEQIPKKPGRYVLLLWLAKSTPLRAGALGQYAFPRGWYTYVGSAYGSGGLHARLKRHWRNDQKKALHWHIDYLRRACALREIWWQTGRHGKECLWGKRLSQMPQARIIAPRFGSSDCRCSTHLLSFPNKNFAKSCALGLTDTMTRLLIGL
ncbi:MAG: GIY-YIG nuclease family protein [Myxococcota bacterium]|jgi:Uri superfamily endonuclease|nr:GIY-YIG nuclease family protein [Myxococcota bacterium]|tara:strand:- start:428 stop:892 length:465 start_codon:yes stop_codon:yes gene_type:complete